MKQGLFLFLLVITTLSVRAQELQQMEDELKPLAYAILNEDQFLDRFKADSAFTRGLVKALRTPHSFRYRFDSLITISQQYAPDSSFRIFTWQIQMEDMNHFRQKGAIQMRTNDGSLKLIPLFDASKFTEAPFDSVRTNQNWIGAVYYNIIQTTYNNRKYYTLFGYDENDARSSRKWMEVMTFDANGNPQFGGRYFNYREDDIKPKQPAFRFCLEYKKDANAKLNYDPELNMIVMAHLVSEEGDNKKKHTLVPYGTFEGFKWLGGKWVHQADITQVNPDGRVNPDQTRRKQ
ncbi:MAG: hypothetical protein HYI21_13620 [Sediminibacterium sp. Gen4]|jgi:hypothetical protein|uniref:hypothetical protein n=1 Tax=unclassified Sediminibacterium TaxID=2635961 RepID=UPI0015BD8C83|nr:MULTISPECIES: hypothetical protein [unclassified Sediminibacterium]MBW0160204.1 hypothetical protein [Sediminibacterium sp.]MBW0163766.1 hypothetical protein [Sediminibacterium sp.]NWK67061.1 hypothetical protein [Sediminibacterium sp. Gen4]